MKTKISGVITALVTPFLNGEVDEKSFVKLLHRQLDEGVQGFVVNGTTGESPTLSRAEVRRIFDLAKTEVAGQVPLIVGTGSNATSAAVEFSREVCTWKPDALLTVVPYYNKPPQRGLREHFRQIAMNSSVPVLLYNVPGRTVASLDPATVAQLSEEKNIVGIKDATGDMSICETLKKSVPADFALLSGDDGTCVDFCARGGHGVISVSSHIIAPEMRECLKDPKHSAADYKTKYSEFMKHLYIEANPIPVKAALYWMGVIASPEMRLPLQPLDEKFHKDFQACLKNLGKLN